LPCDDTQTVPLRALCTGGGIQSPVASPAGNMRMRDRLGQNLMVATNGNKPAAQPAAPVAAADFPTRAGSKDLGRRKGSKTILPSQRDIFRTLTENEKIEDIYDFGEQIYCRAGANAGQVLTAIRRSDGAEVVVKLRTKMDSAKHERSWMTIMNQMKRIGQSRHICDTMEIIEAESLYYIIMPKCDGGELFDFLVNELEVPEVECKRIIREILTAVGHLHKNNLIHRDIKPENIMFHDDTQPIEPTSPWFKPSFDDPSSLDPISPKTVKLIDFDTCAYWTPESTGSRHFVGTRGYIAPEALKGKSCPQSDIWSIGVILHILMTGEMPWSDASRVSIGGEVGSDGAIEMYNSMKVEPLDWSQDPWPDFPIARDLCENLLAFNVEDRIQTVEEALRHDWLCEKARG